MEYRTLGKSDLQVSTVALGGWSLIGDLTWGEQDPRDSESAILAALEAGINFIDTAEGYGNGASEEIIGRALENRRDEVVIASKVSGQNLAPDKLKASCEASLERLRTDRIDLYQIHWPSRQTPLAESVGALETLRTEGKIRQWGVSNFGVRDLQEALSLGACVSNQLAYSLLSRGLEFELQEICETNGVGILCYSPLAQGLLTGKFTSPEEVPPGRARTRHFSSGREHTRHGEGGCEEETFAAIRQIAEICRRREIPMGEAALAWLLARPAVASVIAGARDVRQVKRNALAADRRLGEDVVRELEEATEAVKNALGTNLDLWVGGEDSRIR